MNERKNRIANRSKERKIEPSSYRYYRNKEHVIHPDLLDIINKEGRILNLSFQQEIMVNDITKKIIVTSNADAVLLRQHVLKSTEEKGWTELKNFIKFNYWKDMTDDLFAELKLETMHLSAY